MAAVRSDLYVEELAERLDRVPGGECRSDDVGLRPGSHAVDRMTAVEVGGGGIRLHVERDQFGLGSNDD